MQAAIRYIIPHAFGEHENCDITWCRLNENQISYKHKDLPRGKNGFLEQNLELHQTIYLMSIALTLAKTLVPLANSQRNEALNSIVKRDTQVSQCASNGNQPT